MRRKISKSYCWCYCCLLFCFASFFYTQTKTPSSTCHKFQAACKLNRGNSTQTKSLHWNLNNPALSFVKTLFSTATHRLATVNCWQLRFQSHVPHLVPESLQFVRWAWFCHPLDEAAMGVPRSCLWEWETYETVAAGISRDSPVRDIWAKRWFKG